MRKILFILTIPFFIISCSDKSIIISGDRKEVLNENIDIEINSEASSEIFNLGNEISNQSFTHLGLNKSHSGGHLLGPNNKLLKSWVKDIGKGLSKNYTLMPNLVANNDMIIAMDVVGNLKALNANNGKILWENKSSDSKNSYSAIAGGLSIYNDVLFSHLGGLNVFSFNALSGDEIWRKSFDLPVVGGPTANSKGVFYSLIDGSIKFLDKENGEIIWEKTGVNEINGNIGTGSIAINDDIAIVPGFGGDISILDIVNGDFLWEDNLASMNPKTAVERISSIKAAPVIDRDNFFAISQSGRFASYNLNYNSMNWELNISGSQMPWISGDSLFVISDDANLFCIRKEDGAIRWRVKLPYKIAQKFIPHFGPIVASEKVYIVSGDKMLRIYNALDGDLIEEIKFNASFSTQPIILNSTLYLINDNAKIYAYK